MQILSLSSTECLLSLATVCHRFRNLIDRIIFSRMFSVKSLKDRKLILECYHPTAQYTEPYLFCDYLGSTRLDTAQDQKSLCDVGDAKNSFDMLNGLYSRFKLTIDDIGTNTVCSPVDNNNFIASNVEDSLIQKDEVISRTISMDSHELFSQLCISIAIVQMGPRRGVFLSCIDVLKKTTARIWKQWLAENSRHSKDSTNCFEPERLIWADHNRQVGLRVQVKEHKWQRDGPILQHNDEDQAVSYHLELKGMSASFVSNLAEANFSLQRICSLLHIFS